MKQLLLFRVVVRIAKAHEPPLFVLPQQTWVCLTTTILCASFFDKFLIFNTFFTIIYYFHELLKSLFVFYVFEDF